MCEKDMDAKRPRFLDLTRQLWTLTRRPRLGREVEQHVVAQGQVAFVGRNAKHTRRRGTRQIVACFTLAQKKSKLVRHLLHQSESAQVESGAVHVEARTGRRQRLGRTAGDLIVNICGVYGVTGEQALSDEAHRDILKVSDVIPLDGFDSEKVVKQFLSMRSSNFDAPFLIMIGSSQHLLVYLLQAQTVATLVEVDDCNHWLAPLGCGD
mmetsp:Transcript_27743/g.74854  ORF Transcript_27743/g.74854 Transcript_27743/m.74854 type:complete len:209 (-) Transcript_27743:335-961(-)